MLHIRDFQYIHQDYEALVQVINRVWPEVPYTAADLQRLDRERPSYCTHRRFLAQIDGQIVAQGSFAHNRKFFHPQRFWLQLDVLPDQRRQGIGGRLYAHMLALLCAEYDANELHATTTESRGDSLRFLQERGFQVIKRDPQSRLDIAQYNFDPYRELARKIAAMGIELRTLSDLLRNDAQALRKVYDLHQLLAHDVPDPAQRTRVEFETWREGYTRKNPYYIPQANFMALDGSDLLGMTSLWGDPSTGSLNTGLTGVKRPFRRKGIATALKLRTIAYAQAHGISVIKTSNNSENSMYRLNLKLGFETYDAEMKLKNIICV